MALANFQNVRNDMEQVTKFNFNNYPKMKWKCTDNRLKEKNTRGKDSMKFGFGQIGDVGQ